MDNIQYDPERILNGLPEDVLKELAKKLKRRIRLTKNDIIQEILCPPKGKPEARVKVWQEINRQLRKELETFSEEVSTMFSPADVPIEERFKVGYMFTLSSNPEIRALGEELYCQAEQKNEQEKEDSVAFVAHITATTEAKEEKESIEVREAKESIEAIVTEEIVEARVAEEMVEARVAEEMVEARVAEEMVEARVAEEMVEARVAEEMVEARTTEEMVEARVAEEMVEARTTEEMVGARTTEEMVEARTTEEMVEARTTEEMVESRAAEEVVESRAAEEMVESRATEETIKTRDTEAMTEAREADEMIEAREEKSVVTSTLRIPSEEQITEETEELQRRIKTLENKLRKAIEEGLRTKGQLEKLKIEMVALKSQWVREKEETGKYRNRVKELEEERLDKEKEIDALKQKLEQRKTLAPQKTKEQPLRRELQKVKGESGGEIDLALYQGRKALIFAERDNDVDIRLNALGIIPIWAMEIDWKRPRRRMSTCEIVLYKMNDKKLKKLDEIRDIARYWNIPCNELLNI